MSTGLGMERDWAGSSGLPDSDAGQGPRISCSLLLECRGCGRFEEREPALWKQPDLTSGTPPVARDMYRLITGDAALEVHVELAGCSAGVEGESARHGIPVSLTGVEDCGRAADKVVGGWAVGAAQRWA